MSESVKSVSAHEVSSGSAGDDSRLIELAERLEVDAELWADSQTDQHWSSTLESTIQLEREAAAALRELAAQAEEIARLRGLLREAQNEIQTECDRTDFMGDETAELLARIDAALKEQK